MLLTTESITLLNSETNQEKYEHTCQVENLNLGDRFHYKKPKQPIYDQYSWFISMLSA